MYLTHTRHRIKDYALWRAAFDANVPMLEKAGVLGTWIIQVNDDPLDIVVLNTWPDRRNWDDFIAMHKFTSPDDAKKAREKGGVVGDPIFWGGEVM